MLLPGRGLIIDVQDFKYAMKILLVLLLVVNFLGCTIPAATEADRHSYISEEEASEIASQYVAEKNFLWGESISVRLIYNTYVFSYLTPLDETPKLSERTLHVDKLTGAVSVPLRF